MMRGGFYLYHVSRRHVSPRVPVRFRHGSSTAIREMKCIRDRGKLDCGGWTFQNAQGGSCQVPCRAPCQATSRNPRRRHGLWEGKCGARPEPPCSEQSIRHAGASRGQIKEPQDIPGREGGMTTGP